jgi:hypothetical protein
LPNPPTLATDFSQPEAWKQELERSRRFAETYWPDWEASLNYYIGKSPDAADANADKQSYVNINADFYNVELKVAQLFYETPNLTLTAKGDFRAPAPAQPMPGMPPQPTPDPTSIIHAHRELLNELLGPNHANVLPTIHKAIKDCLLTAGCGVTKIMYTPTMQTVPSPLSPAAPAAPAALPDATGDMGAPVQPTMIEFPVDEQWSWERVPSKKFRIPADFHSTDFDKSPWLAMDFRMPLSMAKRTLKLPEDYNGTTERDDKVLNDIDVKNQDTSQVPYIDGTEIWYLAHIFDSDVIHPGLIRRHVIVDGVDGFVEKDTQSPFQTLLPNGRLSADSMRGYPLHVLTLRDVPDSAYVPSDSAMARPLVRELCKFRSQQVMERDANLPRFLYDSSKITPTTLQKIIDGTIGSMIAVEEGMLDQGAERIIAQVTQGSQTRGSYAANDYIQRDLDKTLGIDATGAGVKGEGTSTATEIATIDKQRNVRLDNERRRVLAWYLKGVEKFSALVCARMTPQLAVPFIGQQAANTWAGWDKQKWDGRFVFNAKADSQIKLDAAAERKFALDLYTFVARDPNVNRVPILRNLLEKANVDPGEVLVTQPPKKQEDPALAFSFRGEDLLGPQAPQVREILAQAGIQISPQAIGESANQLFQQVTLGLRDASGKATPAVNGPQAHPGPAEQVRPLSQQSADQTGQRAGQKPMT